MDAPRLFLLTAALFGTAGPPAHARAAPSDGSITYKVKSGDTLLGLAERYLVSRDRYKIVQRQNKIANPRAVPVGTVISIPRTLLKLKPAVAKIISVRGQVNAGTGSATVGQTVSEGIVISTGPSSFATMQLADGSRISLPSNSDVRIRRM
ncbi:MAG: LysM peptidoglycan-binding domain-containing protein, partial [Sphingorhabdus sp.]